MKSKSPFEFVLRDTEKSMFLGSLDFGDVAFSVENVSMIESRQICT